MRRLLMLSVYIFSLMITLHAQESHKQTESFNRLAKDAFNRVEKHSTRDSVAIFKAVIDGVDYTLKSDEYDRMPNRKGKIEPRFEEENKKRLAVLYPMLIDAGKYFCKKNATRADGMEVLKLYLASKNNSLLVDRIDESGVAAYYLAYYYWKGRDYLNADKYADLAMKYDETAQAAAEIKAQCMGENMITYSDSLRYIAVLQKLYRTEPTNEKYFSWIMKFYQNSTKNFNLEDFVDARLEENYNSVIPWILKGEIAMHAQRWEEAIEAYKQAEEIDPSNIPVVYNIGVCLNMFALDLRERTMKDKIDKNRYLDLFAEARTYLERVRAKDPRRNKVDWVGPLYLDYTMLNDKIKADELEPLVNNFTK